MSPLSMVAENKKQEVIIKTKIYCDHCAKCETCKARVEGKVYELKGVQQVEMNPGNETIRVVFNPKRMKIETIKTQINKSGYDADEMIASEKEVAELDGCCRK